MSARVRPSGRTGLRLLAQTAFAAGLFLAAAVPANAEALPGAVDSRAPHHARAIDFAGFGLLQRQIALAGPALQRAIVDEPGLILLGDDVERQAVAFVHFGPERVLRHHAAGIGPELDGRLDGLVAVKFDKLDATPREGLNLGAHAIGHGTVAQGGVAGQVMAVLADDTPRMAGKPQFLGGNIGFGGHEVAFYQPGMEATKAPTGAIQRLPLGIVHDTDMVAVAAGLGGFDRGGITHHSRRHGAPVMM